MALTVEGDSLHLDFTGSDPQVSSALNIATHGVTHPFICQAILAYILTMDPQIPKASSILRPVRVTAPPGTIVNLLFPAAIGVRYATVIRVFDAILGALAQALPGQVPAAPAGATSPVVASVLDPFTGQRQVQVVEPMIGGGGGRPTMDGVDGADSTSGYLRNTPVESVEAEVPIVLRRYHLIPGTGGPGRNRGGLALRLDFEFSHPHSIVTARGMERFKLAPWGLHGGRAGTSGSCVVNRGTDRERDIGKVDVLHLEPGDVVSIFAPSGGGTAIRASVTPSACAPTCGRAPRWNKPGSSTGWSSWAARWTRRPPPPPGRPCRRRRRGCSTSAPGAWRWSSGGLPRCRTPRSISSRRCRPRFETGASTGSTI